MEVVEELKPKKTRTQYMREYKKKEYLTKGPEIKLKQKQNYCVNKYKLPKNIVLKHNKNIATICEILEVVSDFLDVETNEITYLTNLCNRILEFKKNNKNIKDRNEIINKFLNEL